MKLVRYGPRGGERPGILDADGNIRDLQGMSEDFGPRFFAGDGLRKLSELELSTLPIVPKGARLGPCIAQPGNFVAIGLNYIRHARETNAPIPTDPILFNKAPSCVSGAFDPVILPKKSTKTDWEVELALVIGKKAHYVDESTALDFVAGYCVCNDVSEREFQLERSGQWVKGKMAPTFGPLGPWLVTPDEIEDVQKLRLWLELNGRRIQDSSTSDMIFPVAKLIADTSQYVVLQPGDVITTGTPPGVGLGMKPPQFLKAGDVMRLGIDGLGVQEQRVVRWEDQQSSERKSA
jgi:2-keto-4-pentenoate hydratase/2-oxohepta-3-ene-1,7-dioic acid hydratase in catechol pathway